MELYFGGAYQGKLDYVCGRKNIVKELCGNAEDTMSNIYSEDDKCCLLYTSPSPRDCS